MKKSGRPAPSEYDPYFKPFIEKVKGSDIIKTLNEQHTEIQHLLSFVTEKEAPTPYEKGKRTIKEILGHLNDTERVMIYRALVFARGDLNNLPGFNPDVWVKKANFNSRSLEDLLHKFRMLRISNIAFYNTLDDEMLARIGKADGKKISVKALFYYSAGHERHHLDLIKKHYRLRVE